MKYKSTETGEVISEELYKKIKAEARYLDGAYREDRLQLDYINSFEAVAEEGVKP